jgi:hypothetical protein
MKKLALVALGVLSLASAALGAERRPSREEEFHPHRVCIAVDAEGYQYLGYDDDAMENALAKCVGRSDSPNSCRVSSCFNDVGFREDFMAE